jgi:hypothetical protein
VVAEVKASSRSTSKSTPKKRPGTKNGAKKGKAFERQIANELGHIFPDAQRMLEYQGSDNIGVDLQKTDIFLYQCKCWANYANPNVIFEVRPPTDKHIPVLVTKANNRPTMAVLHFKDYVTLLEIAYGLRERLINPYMTEKLQPLTGGISSHMMTYQPANYPTLADLQMSDDFQKKIIEATAEVLGEVAPPDFEVVEKLSVTEQLKLYI